MVVSGYMRSGVGGENATRRDAMKKQWVVGLVGFSNYSKDAVGYFFSNFFGGFGWLSKPGLAKGD